jgi:polar amino acid transport system substrate-binding protein
MSKKHLAALVTALLVVALAVGLVAGGCGSKKAATTGGSKIEAAIGHAPTGLAATIATNGVIVIADDSNYAPQSFIDKATSTLKGFDVDVGKRSAELLGVTAKFKNPAWDSVIPGLGTDKWDVSIGSMTITPTRLKQVDFTDPYYYTQAQLIVKAGAPQINGVAALKGKTIGVGTDTTYLFFLQAVGGIKIKTYTTDLDALPDLKNGRLDAVMTADLTASQAIASGQPFELSGDPLYFEPLAFAINKGQPDLLAALNHSIKTMHSDGSLTAYSKTWYHGFDVTLAPKSGVASYTDAMLAVGGTP